MRVREQSPPDGQRDTRAHPEYLYLFYCICTGVLERDTRFQERFALVFSGKDVPFFILSFKSESNSRNFIRDSTLANREAVHDASVFG